MDQIERRLALRQLDAAEDDVADIPGLGVEHVERVELVLHADVEEARIVLIDDHRVDIDPDGWLLIGPHKDKPGIIGKVCIKQAIPEPFFSMFPMNKQVFY